jgi:hypothetical protein
MFVRCMLERKVAFGIRSNHVFLVFTGGGRYGIGEVGV